MSYSVAYKTGRNASRLVLVAVAGAWLTGCSSDTTRLAGGDPFSNPFRDQNQTAYNAGPAPTPQVSSQPLPGTVNNAYIAPSHANPVAANTVPAPAPSSVGAVRAAPPAAVGGSAAGWSAVGGTPVVVGEADSLDTLSRRFGVPSSALLGANGLSSPGQVRPGMRIIVPVYSATNRAGAAPAAIPNAVEPSPAPRHGLAAAKAEPQDDSEPATKVKAKAKAAAADVNDADQPAKPSKLKAKKAPANDDADAEPAKAKSAKPDKKLALVPAEKPTAELKADKKPAAVKLEPPKAEKKVAEATVKPDKAKDAKTVADTTAKTPAKPAVAAADPAPPAASAAPADTTKVASGGDSGNSPEFRWPARGRIIQGYKQSGNDGINISVPEGTSVRAAESGTVAYAGNGLKGYGNLVLIQHPNGFVSAYANNGEINVKRGETVKRGQVIAKSGESGNVTAPQIHFELRDKSGAPVDPTNFLAGI